MCFVYVAATVHTEVEEETHLVWTLCSRTCTAAVGYSDRCCPCHNPPSGSSPRPEKLANTIFSVGLFYYFINQPITFFVYAKLIVDIYYITIILLYFIITFTI